MTLLKAQSNGIEIDLKRSALLVADMQNAFAKRGGMMDLVGADVCGAKSGKDAVNHAQLDFCAAAILSNFEKLLGCVTSCNRVVNALETYASVPHAWEPLAR
ncbi:MAG: nicotinamidase-related amidase [Gammaproteobacteria bacterium]|jgi:nicotinamidase-related amidase